MKLRKNWDRTSPPLDSGRFVGQIVAEESFNGNGPIEIQRAQIETLRRFCQALFDVLPDKTKTKIAADFGWEPIE